jgi:hypothetical protein
MPKGNSAMIEASSLVGFHLGALKVDRDLSMVSLFQFNADDKQIVDIDVYFFNCSMVRLSCHADMIFEDIEICTIKPVNEGYIFNAKNENFDILIICNNIYTNCKAKKIERGD